MKSRNSVMTKPNAPRPALSTEGKASFSQSRPKAFPNKKNKSSLIPIRSHQQNNQKAPMPEKHKEEWTAKKGHDLSPNQPDMDIPIMVSPRDQTSTVFSQDYVVSKYIDRFRYGQPMSREERQRMSSVPEGWRSSSSLPPSSTATKTSHKDQRRDPSSTLRSQLDDDFNSSLCIGDHNMDTYVLSDTSQSEFEDTELLHLQEKASMLLQRGDSILRNGLIPVTSDGLGRSPLSAPVSIAEPVYRPLINTTLTSMTAMPLQRYTVTPSIAPPVRPEEDILFQWRLRRKMEQANEQCQSQQHSARLASPFHAGLPSSSVNVQPSKQQQIIQCPEPTQEAPLKAEAHRHLPSPAFPVSDSSVVHPQSLPHVPAHMHLLCDLLPCPSRSQGNSHNLEETQVSGNTYMEEPAHRHIPSPPPGLSKPIEVGWICRPMNEANLCSSVGGCIDKTCPARPSEGGSSSRVIEEKSHTRPREGGCLENYGMTEMAAIEKQTKQLGDGQKKTEGTIRKQKKLTRSIKPSEHANGSTSISKSSAHQKPPKKNKSRMEQQQQQEKHKEKDNHTPPSSPVQQALGQVVSEVLFPPTDASPAQVAAVPSLPTPSHTSSLEVMSQLLQEAEDSDEKEFEDDPLLQVLRTQRKWVMEQMSEVDSMLHKFVEKQKVSQT
uniref:proline and serine-rich protein 3 isoform X2 n=1 Tax=Doryrhamphus excisus TaxID=161450 RepID=UPI0025AD9EFA|nr:proline and serine-rich protein 3 isoform X2 [Doryrhamphus excisus]